jgi:hypothetical protein
MRFPPQFLDELRARLPVSEVVGRRVKLRKTGREFKGLSPFNKEKTPSFFVNDQKQAWFDFSSGKNGSIFDFIMQSEGVSFPEAVERLAQMAGMPLPKVSREDEARDARRKTLHDVMEIAAKFFEATLASHPAIHTAEGEFFRSVVRCACEDCGLHCHGVKEKELEAHVASIADLGKLLGPPWQRDQKFAALAAWVVLADNPKR